MTTEIRLAEDQMQRLMRCICAVGHMITNGDKATYEQDWQAAGCMLFEEPEEGSYPNPTPIVPDDTIIKMQRDEIDRLRVELAKRQPQVYHNTTEEFDALRKIEELRAENEELKTELSKCAWHKAFEEYEDDNAKLRAEIDELKARVPKERLRAYLDFDLSDNRWKIFLRKDLGEIPYIMFSHAHRETAHQWAMDRGMEVMG